MDLNVALESSLSLSYVLMSRSGENDYKKVNALMRDGSVMADSD